jgi:spore coat polysaccharide biosynthesis protein SpsF (cytidylyltransferase family)
MKDKIKILVCTRLDSKRLPNKAMLPIAGKPTIQHLLERLQASRYETILCTTDQPSEFPLVHLAEKMGIQVFKGNKENVLKRMVDCSYCHYKMIVRVTADDLLIDVPLLEMMVEDHLKKKADYTFVSGVPEGIATEIIDTSLLKKALKNANTENTEFVSYYARRWANKINKFHPPQQYLFPCRLTLDYPEDFLILNILFDNLPRNFSVWELIDYLKRHPYLLEINKLPKITVYIANHNYGQYLERAIKSVLNQSFQDFELIIIDDCSTDNSLEVMLKYSNHFKIKLLRNETNLRLAATSNKALMKARGKYIIRLDSDDELCSEALEKMSKFLDEYEKVAIVYPNYFYESNGKSIIKKGKECHHPACAMIRKKCWNEIKYNENRQCLEGKDFYLRFKQKFSIGYLEEPLFIYHQHPDSLSKDIKMQTIEKREIKKKLSKIR